MNVLEIEMEKPINHPRELVRLYRAFYRANTKYNPSARKTIQPLHEACEILCRSDVALRESQILIPVIAGKLDKIMYQIHGGSALGKWVITDRAEERQAILVFVEFFVNEVFYGGFAGDLGRFAGIQRGYLEDTCEFIYRIEQDAENKAAQFPLVDKA